MTGQETLPTSVKKKIEEMREWQQELEEWELQLEKDYQILNLKTEELIKAHQDLQSEVKVWNKEKQRVEENFTRELLSKERKLENQIEELEGQVWTLKCDIREKEKHCHELIAVSKSLEKDNIEERKRINNLLSVERENQNRELRYLEQKDTDIKMRDKKLIEREQKQDKALIKSVAIFIVGAVLIMISVLFIRGYLMSDNRAMNKYNKALISYNNNVEDINAEINDKKEVLKEKEETWEYFECDNDTGEHFETVCPSKKIKSLKSDIELLEEQKQELVEPQEPTQ